MDNLATRNEQSSNFFPQKFEILRIIFVLRFYLKTGNVTDSEEFFVVQVILTKKYRMYSKEKMAQHSEKEPPRRGVDVCRQTIASGIAVRF